MRTAIAMATALTLSATLGAQATTPQTPAAAPAQVTITFQSQVVQQYKSAKTYLTKIGEVMPEGDYAFKPTPEMRTFAGTMGHIIMSNIGQCGSLLGKKHELSGQDLSKTLTTKAEVVKANADAFAFCDEYFNALTDQTPLENTFTNMSGRRGGEPVQFKVSNAATLMHFLEHNNEELGYLAVYLRLKGIVPPQSQPATPAPGRGRSGGAR